MTLPSYPSYKYSGAAWLAEVPEHWVVKKIKREFIAQSGTDEKTDHGPFPLFGANGVIGQSNTASIKKPCVLIGRVGSAGELNFITQVAGVSDNALIVSNRVFDAPRYDFYLFQAADIKSSVSKNAQPLITASVITDRLMAVPDDLCERIQIARFLDHETARIDALIEEQQRLIELLKEKRQAVISQAVTKGLDPTVPMKDSGVEWLGEVPAHWDFKQSKYLFEFVTSGSRGWAEFYADDGDLFFRIANLTRDSIEPKLATLQYVNPPSNAEGERSKVRLNDILISITADLGSVCVANEAVVGSYVSQHVALARPMSKSVFGRWLAYFVLSTTCKDQLVGAGYGGTKVQLSLDDIRTFWVSVPPYEEQLLLAAFLDKEIKAFDGLIVQASIGVDLLSERRSALISAAVTGKIDVRGWQPPTSAQAPKSVQEAV